MNKTKTSLFLNATALSRLFTCDRLYQVSCLWGYSEHGASADWGSKFHKFAEEHATKPGYTLLDYFKNHGAVDEQFVKVVSHYTAIDPLKDNALLPLSPSVEHTFSFNIAEDDDYQVILCGTIDRLDYEDGCIRVLDFKTARSPKTDEVLSAYSMQLQMPFYLHVLANYIKLPPADKALIDEGKFFGKYMGVFISFSPARFLLSEKIILTDDLNIWILGILSTAIEKMISLAKLGPLLALPTGMSSYIDGKSACDKCWMKNICVTRNEKQILDILSLKPTTPYDPRTWR